MHYGAQQQTNFTNPRMHLFHIPQCSIWNRNVHISVLNETLWYMENAQSEICEFGQLLNGLAISDTRLVMRYRCHRRWYPRPVLFLTHLVAKADIPSELGQHHGFFCIIIALATFIATWPTVMKLIAEKQTRSYLLRGRIWVSYVISHCSDVTMGALASQITRGLIQYKYVILPV